jgi:hypothetical protein
VNLDVKWTQSGWVNIPLEEFGIEADEEFVVRDLLTGATYTWKGGWNYVELNPQVNPAHIFSIERSSHNESDALRAADPSSHKASERSSVMRTGIELPVPSGVPKHG